jgi:anti-sigma factor (TIGR02949 family)
MPRSQSIRCEEVIAQLFSFLDGEVEARQHTRIEKHLEECRSCCSRADFELALRERVREVGDEKPSPDFRSRIRQLINRF